MRLLVGCALGVMSGSATQAGEAPAAFEMKFAMPAADTLGAIAQGCIREEETVTSRDGEAVVCEIPMGRFERIAARVVLREPFTPSPRAFVRFAVTPSSSATSTIQVSSWVEDDRAPAIRHWASLAGRRFDGHMQAFLFRLRRPSPRPD